jgi:hypothetical protein
VYGQEGGGCEEVEGLWECGGLVWDEDVGGCCGGCCWGCVRGDEMVWFGRFLKGRFKGWEGWRGCLSRSLAVSYSHEMAFFMFP